MNRLWLFLTIFLDTYPWLFLQYMPFRGALRLGYKKTLPVLSGALLVWQLGFVWIAYQDFYTPGVMLAYRLFQLALLQVLTLALMRGSFAKITFVFCLLFPISMLVLVAACFIAGLFPGISAPPYMAVSLIRLGLSALLFPVMRGLWLRILIPVMDVQDNSLWRSAWPIPAAFTFISIFYTGDDFELAGVTANELMGRLAIFLGTLLSCLLLFRSLGQIKERTRAAEEAANSRRLLGIQAEQYRRLAKSIENARRARHDMRQHLAAISGLARRGDSDALLDYVSRLESAPDAKPPITLCENSAANAILTYYVAKAGECGANMRIRAAIPRDIGIDGIDLTIVLGNLVENALEACAALSAPDRKIDIKARAQGSRLFIVITNSCENAARPTEGGLLSRKRGYADMGVGLQSVRAVCEKYRGEMRVEPRDDSFTASVMLECRASA